MNIYKVSIFGDQTHISIWMKFFCDWELTIKFLNEFKSLLSKFYALTFHISIRALSMRLPRVRKLTRKSVHGVKRRVQDVNFRIQMKVHLALMSIWMNMDESAKGCVNTPRAPLLLRFFPHASWTRMREIHATLSSQFFANQDLFTNALQHFVIGPSLYTHLVAVQTNITKRRILSCFNSEAVRTRDRAT